MLTPKQKLHLTSGFALFLQVFTIVYGFVLPRLFLEYFGSAVNGLVSSISQFLGFIALAECGVGAVVQSALYKPLAQKNNVDLTRIIVSAEHFFRNIAKLLLLYTFILLVIYPNLVNGQFDYLYTASLVFIIAISSFAQYYFGITYRLLLNSDQLGFIPYIIQIVALSLNLGISVFLMKAGTSVHIVKLASSTVFLFQPLTISFIAHKWYKFERGVQWDKSAIPQKWNGLAQHISAVVLQSSGVFVLTIFSTLENVSVYAIYNIVIQGVKSLTMSITNGMQAFLGNLFAKGDMCAFRVNFEKFEWKLHFVVTLVFSTTAILIVPFVKVYTKGITDANYTVPLFGITLTVAWGMYCIRLPYNIVVLAVGHYRQTQTSAIVEAILNLVTAIVFVLKFGLVGVAVGTFVAMVYRSFYLAWYISKNVIKRSLCVFAKILIIDLTSIGLITIVSCLFGEKLLFNDPQNYLEWMFFAVQEFMICLSIISFINVCFNYKKFSSLLRNRLK